MDKTLATYSSHTVCPKICYPYYTVTYNIKWVTTSWTYSIYDAESISQQKISFPTELYNPRIRLVKVDQIKAVPQYFKSLINHSQTLQKRSTIYLTLTTRPLGQP